MSLSFGPQVTSIITLTIPTLEQSKIVGKTISCLNINHLPGDFRIAPWTRYALGIDDLTRLAKETGMYT